MVDRNFPLITFTINNFKLNLLRKELAGVAKAPRLGSHWISMSESNLPTPGVKRKGLILDLEFGYNGRDSTSRMTL